jgi:uncharacterized protein
MNASANRDEMPAARVATLASVLTGMGDVAVAVSGGVDSMTLACFARQTLGRRATMFHALSPAVPADATARVRRVATERDWNLEVIDAREFDNGDYVANPVNRCFHCKTSLYAAIGQATRAQIVSGTNLDDLSDYRPGLIAARDHGVRHPFVEARIPKGEVRALARRLELHDIAELPSSPCLSSRIETGIAIEPDTLDRVHAVEQLIRERHAPSAVRCRVRAEGVVIELDEALLAQLSDEHRDTLAAEVRALFAPTRHRPVAFARYVTGSAFLRGVPIVG